MYIQAAAFARMDCVHFMSSLPDDCNISITMITLRKIHYYNFHKYIQPAVFVRIDCVHFMSSFAWRCHYPNGDAAVVFSVDLHLRDVIGRDDHFSRIQANTRLDVAQRCFNAGSLSETLAQP